MAIDRFDWHYESARDGYCERENKNPDELTEEETRVISKLSSAHIGLFLKWIIVRGFGGEDTDEESAELVKKGELTGTDYLLDCCDGKLWDSDIDEKLHPIVEDLYNDYLNSISEMFEQLDKSCYCFIESPDDYPAAERLLDKLFEKYKDKI